MTSTPTNTKQASEALLAMLVESAGLVIVVTVAGINDQIATLMLVFVLGLWLLFIIMHSDQLSSFTNTLSNIEKGAQGG